MNLILFEPHEIENQTTARVSGVRARHIQKVLRAIPGDTLRIGLLNGPKGIGTLIATDGAEVTMQCQWEAVPPPLPRIDLLLALPRPKVLNRLLPVLATLGVGRIMLSNAWKVEKNYFDTHVLEPSWMRRAFIEGLQQAADTHLPAVTIHRTLREWMEQTAPHVAEYARCLVAHPGGESKPLLSAARDIPPHGRILLAIGPEGGWIPDELSWFCTHAFIPVTSGSRILRSDTACISLISVLHAALNGI